MSDVLRELYEVVQARKENPQEGSYTCYLFEKGLDKILKKIGEEASEVVIAAKNGKNAETAEEICDLLYHLTVLMSQQNIPPDDVFTILKQRSAKIGNLKQFHQVDRDS
jgi:phosphoribosyl-ATP pyrophosphohydrolase